MKRRIDGQALLDEDGILEAAVRGLDALEPRLGDAGDVERRHAVQPRRDPVMLDIAPHGLDAVRHARMQDAPVVVEPLVADVRVLGDQLDDLDARHHVRHCRLLAVFGSCRR
ncbi:MAG: hypothetical protein U0S48_20300 [Solirubrobacteraceae bacterium]